MTDNDLVAIIRSNRRDSLGVEDGGLSNERAKAMDHYHGRPYGNEEEGRSQVVSKDLSETVDWALPAIMRIFTQSGDIAEFDPVGPEDEDQALQESDYINQVIMKDNHGFLVLHDVFKDALLLKNGYFKHYWDETEKIKEDQYQGLTIEEITVLLQDLEAKSDKVEIVGQEEKQIEVMTPQGMMPVPVFDIRVKATKKIGRVRIEAVPPEEVRVSKRCRGSLQESPFVEHVTKKTRTDLIEMGIDKTFVNSLPAFNERVESPQALARDSVSDESEEEGLAFSDRSMDEIEFCEAYIRVDWDGDGIAELRKVVTCADRIPPGDEWNEVIEAVPMTGCVPKRVPHRHVGESLDDELADLQEIKTTLLRQLLDNIYLTNNNQWLVNERVNLADFMQSLPGGIKRVKGYDPVGGSVEPVVTQPIIGQVLPAIDYIDNIKEARTGINRATTGLDPDILKQSTKGAFVENLNRASQKIEMITRMLGETGVRELVQQVHGLLIRHQDKARMVKMRGKFVSVNPSEWEDRTDMTLRVGLGTGTEEEKREKLLLVSSLQDKLAAAGLVGPQQAYALFEDIAKVMGFDMPERYALSPMSPEFAQMQQAQANQPPPPNPLAEVEQIKQQAANEREQMNLQFKAAVEQMNINHAHQMHVMKAQMDMQNAEADRRSKEIIEAAKLEFSALLKQIPSPDIGPAGIGGGLAQ